MEKMYVGLLKEIVCKDMLQDNSPMVLCDYLAERRGGIFSVTARGVFQLNEPNPHTMTFGYEADISNVYRFGWYKWCPYFDDSKVRMFPFQNSCLRSVLGPAKNKGD